MKTIEEINDKIRKKTVVVVNAEEMIKIVEDHGAKKASEMVDVVTTGTFGPMCSSGAVLNTGHTSPRIRVTKAKLNNVPAYCGIAAVDYFLGATELMDGDPANTVHPGQFEYGGAHVIEDLVSGKNVMLEAQSYGTDCYPRKELRTLITINDLNTAKLLNFRNAYQNYNVAVNLSDKKTLYTYMGILYPNIGNANYSSASQLSPLLNDPYYRTVGIGTRIFLGGGIGYVYDYGTQHNPVDVPRAENGVPKGGCGTLAVTGDLKQMSSRYLRAVSLIGYGTSLAVGIGVPIPILDEQMAYFTSIKDQDIYAPVIDYSYHYPQNEGNALTYVNYAQLRSGEIEIFDQKVKTSSLSSYNKAREIADELKSWIQNGKFELTVPAARIHGIESDLSFRRCPERI